MRDEKTRVSAIIATYNSAATISHAIESALAQDFEGFEVIVVDDGSTDATPEVLGRYAGRIRTVRQDNRGTAAARNVAAGAAKGEYLAFLDADDEWLPGKLRASVEALDRSPAASVVYSDFINVSATGEREVKRPMSGSPTLDQLLREGIAFFPTVVVMRRSVFVNCGGFCEEFPGTGFEDSFLGLVAREQGPFIHIGRPLAVYQESDPVVKAERYRRSYRVLRRMVRQRYGPSGRPFILRARAFYASLLAGSAGLQIRQRRYGRAAVTILRTSFIDPMYLLKAIANKYSQAR
jgi:glycosyltransferase involved in cell wall biosynthesis